MRMVQYTQLYLIPKAVDKKEKIRAKRKVRKVTLKKMDTQYF